MINKTYTNVRGSGIFSSLGKKLANKFTKKVTEKVTKEVAKKAVEDLAKKAMDKAVTEAPKIVEQKTKELVKNKLNNIIDKHSKNKSEKEVVKKPQIPPVIDSLIKKNIDKSKLSPIIIPVKNAIKKADYNLNNIMSNYLNRYGSGNTRGSGLKIV